MLLACLLTAVFNSDTALADSVVADDLIVQGQQCVGMDCVNNESCSSEALRLKENNLRIRFLDTSIADEVLGKGWVVETNDSRDGVDDGTEVALGTNPRLHPARALVPILEAVLD